MGQFLSKVMSAVDASIDRSSAAIVTQQNLQISAQAVVTGTSTGTLKLQYSNDIVDQSVPLTAPVNWSDIPLATVSIAGAGVYAIANTACCYQFVRAVYTHTNGAAGTLSVNLKGIGL